MSYFGSNAFGPSYWGPSYWGTSGAVGMLTFRQTLVAKLGSIDALTALVGSAIYPGALPEAHDLGRDGPALTYAVTTYPRGHVLAGRDGTAAAGVQLSSWSYLEWQADAIALVLKGSLSGPPANPWTAGGVILLSVTHRDEADLPEATKAGSDQWTYQVASQYLIRHRTGLRDPLPPPPPPTASPPPPPCLTFRPDPRRQAGLDRRPDRPGRIGDLSGQIAAGPRPRPGRAGVDVRRRLESARSSPARAGRHVLGEGPGLRLVVPRIAGRRHRPGRLGRVDVVPANPWAAGGVAIVSVSHRDETDLPEPPKAGSDRWTYRIESEYLIRHRTA